VSSPAGDADGWVSLAQPVYSGLPAGGPNGVVELRTLTHPIGGDGQVQLTLLQTTAHVGTHLDAPVHFVPGGATLDEIPLDRLIAPGVVIDLTGLSRPGVTADFLAPRLGSVQPGDVVFLDFGWAERYGTPEYGDHPYLEEDAAALLVERGAGIVAVDTASPDLPARHRTPDFTFPAHRTLLGAGVLIIENVSAAVSRLSGKRVDVQAIPIPLRGADGAPCSLLVRAR
jgi:arylformamidase